MTNLNYQMVNILSSDNHKSSGFILVFISIIIFIFISIGAFSLYFSIQHFKTVELQKNNLACLIIAESGLAKGVWLLKNNPNFSTDDDFSGSIKKEKQWLLEEAIGLTESINSGNYKIVKEKTKKRLFSIAYLGNSLEPSKARKIIQLNYNILDDNFICEQWQEL